MIKTENRKLIWEESDLWKFTKEHSDCNVKSWGGYIGKEDGYTPYGYSIDISGITYYFDLDGQFLKEKVD